MTTTQNHESPTHRPCDWGGCPGVAHYKVDLGHPEVGRVMETRYLCVRHLGWVQEYNAADSVVDFEEVTQ